MAWCGPDFTIVRVGPAAADDASTLLCFGQFRKGYGTELPDALQEEEGVRTPHAIPRAGFAFRQDAVQVGFGEQHWAVVTAGGGLFSAGDNSWGQLGRGNDSGFLALACVFPRSVSSVACGRQHTLVVYKPLTRGGQQVWGCGRNTDQQLSGEAVRSKNAFFPLDISKLAGDARCVVPAGVATASAPGCVLRIAAGADFSAVCVGGAVGLRGLLPGSPPNSRSAEFRIPAASAAALPWHGSPVRHLVAGSEHVLVGCVCGRRLRVWGWGSSACGELGFPGVAVLEQPTEIVFGCPEQAAGFPSMLAASDGSSVIMVGGRVWALGRQQHAGAGAGAQDSIVVDPRDFDGRAIAYVGTGPRHAAFVTTCGRLYVRGACSWRGLYAVPRDNGLATAFRRTRHGVVGLCEPRPLARARRVPPELLGSELYGAACGLVREPLARTLAFLMGTHARLRGAGGFDAASLDAGVLQQILEACDAALPALVRA